MKKYDQLTSVHRYTHIVLIFYIRVFIFNLQNELFKKNVFCKMNFYYKAIVLKIYMRILTIVLYVGIIRGKIYYTF